MKQCQRCLKKISDEGVHTCTPTELVRKLEAELSATKEKLAAAERFNAELMSAFQSRDAQIGPAWEAYRNRVAFFQHVISQVNKFTEDVTGIAPPEPDTFKDHWVLKHD